MMLRSQAALLAGCALGSLGIMLAQPAQAQAFNGTPTTQAGSVTYDRSTPGVETVTVNSSGAVIQWLGLPDFLPAGNVATFQGAAGNPNYTVLNRVFPGAGAPAPATFNGTVQSRISAVDSTVGGNIYFYSPAGIIASPTSVFNVGSLVLTTLDVTFDAAGNLGSPVLFNGVAGSKAAINIQSGAQINATGSGAYVALVSPSITQAGTVSANGSIAYIAGESVDLTINAGLVDFTINTGTTDTNGIIHTGTTTGPASTSSSDTQVIAMVALPKNAALTMLLTGSIGYTPAASAANEGSSVILAAGYDNPVPNVVPANRFGRILLGLGGTIRNSMTAYATDTVTIDPSLNTFTFENDALIYAVNMIDLTVGAASSVIDAKGNLTLRAGAPGIGGTVNITATDTGQILVGGPFLVNATSDAADFDTVTSYLDGFGGAINITADNGLIRSSTFTQFDVSGFGQFGGSLGGAGQGGSINALVVTDGVIDTPDLTLIAHGFGGGSDATGGNGFGGDILVTDSGGQYDLGILRAFASGYGGGASLDGGDGNSGSVDILITGQPQDWGQLFAVANAEAGLSFGSGPAGLAIVNRAAIDLSVGATGSLNVSDVISLTSNAFSGYNRAAAYEGRAGGISVQATDGASITADRIEIEANADFAGDLPSTGDTTPNQHGGTIDVRADNGTINARLFTATADAYNHPAFVAAGTTDGGTVQVSALIGGTINIGDPLLNIPGDMSLSASAFGAPGPSTAVSTGGTARLIALDGTIRINGSGAVVANASHAAFDAVPDGDGTDAFGGTASVELLSESLGNSIISATSLTVQANGDARLRLTGGSGAAGGDPIVGNGGNGVGGSASVTVDPGTFSVGQLNIETIGRGGTASFIDSLVQFQSGDGAGGTSAFYQNGGTSTVGSLTLSSEGFGGGGAPAATGTTTAGTAGEGIGGLSRLAIAGGSLTATDATIEASGTGGDGMSHSGTGDATDGGDGNGGFAVLEALGGGAITTGALAIRANGIGGIGGTAASGLSGTGGDGFGQTAYADLADGAFSLGDVTIEATATGGSGVVGGAATGGQAQFLLNDSSGPSSARSLASLSVDSSATGAGGSLGTAGLTNLELNTLNAASAVTISGGITLTNLGTDAPAGDGIAVTITGAPVVAGGDIAMTTVRDLTISAGPGLQAGGSVSLDGRLVTTTGLVASGGPMSVISATNISSTALSSGGTTLLQAPNGTLIVGNLLSTGAVTALAQSITIGSTGALNFADVDATAGTVNITTAGNLGLNTVDATGAITLSSTGGAIAATGAVNSGGNVIATGPNGVAFTTLVTGGITQLTATNGAVVATALTSPGPVTALGRSVNIASPGALTFADLDATAGDASVQTVGNLTLTTADATGAITLTSTGGSLVATGAVNAGGAVSASGFNGVTLPTVVSGGPTLLAATNGIVDVDSLTSAGAVTARGRSVDIVSPGALTFADLDATAGPATILTAGNLGLNTVDTTGALTLTSTGGAIAATGAVNSGGALSAIAPNGVSFAALSSGGITLLRATNGAVIATALSSTGNVTALGRSVDIASPGALTFTDLDATAGAASVQTAGNLTVATVDATGAVTLRSTGGNFLSTGAINGSSITLASGGALQANANLTAAGALAIDAGGTFTLNAVGRGTTITAASNDIVLAAGSALGVRGVTTALTVTNRNPSRVTYIGGAANPSGYSLDQAELLRLFSDNTILLGTALTGALPAGQGTIVIDDFALGFGANRNIGSGGTLEISTQGRISVIGDVALTTTGATDTFELDPSLIELDTSLGSIALLDAGGTPLGRLNVIGNTIAMATTTVLPQLSTLTDLTAINALLGQPGGNPLALRAGTMNFNVTGGLYIQNSGLTALYRDRRGFTANGLAITTASPNTRIAINGQILTSSGPLLGLDTQTMITINGAPAAAGGQFDARSTINGCFIGAQCAPPPGSTPPNNTDLTSPVPEAPGSGSLFAEPLVELADTDPLIAPPLVDEPITGVGNDDLWQPACDDPSEDAACPREDGDQ